MAYFEERSIELSELQNIYNDAPSDMIYKLSAVPEILRLNNVSMNSGINFSGFGLCNYKYTKLDHSIGIALILEKFKKDTQQIITGFLSEINTPAFSMATKLMKQDITEYSRYDQIVGSDMLFEFFLKNNITINDVCDPTIYPLIKSEVGRLDAISLEKLLHLSLCEKLCENSEIKQLYNDVIIVPNEDTKPEFAFDTPELGVRFGRISLEIGKKFRAYEAKITIQVIADLLDSMIRRMEITADDLYKFGDRAILEIGINSSDKQISDGWKGLGTLNKIYTRFTPVDGQYCKRIILQNEYVDPLIRVKGGYERASKCDSTLRREIDAYMHSDTDLYAYTTELDFLK